CWDECVAADADPTPARMTLPAGASRVIAPESLLNLSCSCPGAASSNTCSAVATWMRPGEMVTTAGALFDVVMRAPRYVPIFIGVADIGDRSGRAIYSGTCSIKVCGVRLPSRGRAARHLCH